MRLLLSSVVLACFLAVSFSNPSNPSVDLDKFVFNVTLLCRIDGQYQYEAFFNIRDVYANRSIQYEPIGHKTGSGNSGLTRFKTAGTYKLEFNGSPVWEPIGQINHNCQTGHGYNTVKLIFASVPALRNHTLYYYTFHQDITDLKGDHLVEARIVTMKIADDDTPSS